MKNEDVMLQKALHNDAYFIGGVMVGSVKSWRQFYLLRVYKKNICVKIFVMMIREHY